MPSFTQIDTVAAHSSRLSCELTDRTDRDGRRVTYAYDSGGRQVPAQTSVGTGTAVTTSL